MRTHHLTLIAAAAIGLGLAATAADLTVPETRVLDVKIPPVWLKEAGGPVQPLTVTVKHGGPAQDGTLQAGDGPAVKIALKPGEQNFEIKVPAQEEKHSLPVRLVAAGKELAATTVELAPPRLREMWLLPHSHVDIGYTHRQDEVVKLQIGNLETAMRLATESAAQPSGQRFKWNPEAVWTLDHFLQSATPEKRAAFLEAVRRGDVGVDALYGNMLTGLCRPEELAQCLAIGVQIANETGVPLETASICDVPGYTWGLVPIMAQAGVKYFAIGPNFADRVGTIHQWDDQPFYWKSQSGNERVLCWVVDNYHHLGDLEKNVLDQLARLREKDFPFSTAFIFWVGTWPGGGVDNAPPDEKTVEKAVAWNAKYSAPVVTIGLAREFFRDFERKHGAALPEFAGDLTPYWEDGAGSSSEETAMNRNSGDRLAQATTLFAMRDPHGYPAAKFQAAWKNVLLYSEHTWGAHCSISEPDSQFTKDQWKVKGGFAEDAERQSKTLLETVLPPDKLTSGFDVYNTTQWERTDLVLVPADPRGEAVVYENDQPIPCKRMDSGGLFFLARNVPPFGAKRYRLGKEPATPPAGGAVAEGTTLRTPLLNLEVDPKSGAIKSLRLAGQDHDYVDATAAVALNDYRYVLGTDAKGARTNGPVRIEVWEKGPLVAGLSITSEAPGCKKLVRLIRVVDGLDRVEIFNYIDRKSVREKDGVHFGFGFNVPGGTVRMETPWAVVRPNVDQLPGSCRNWFTVQRWVDVSNAECGITWASPDAPLMEIGGLTANLLGSVPYGDWMTKALDSQTLYSWVQNNHWHTNYKIDQPGGMYFCYILRPHRGGYSAADVARFGLETTRPLLVAAASGPQAPGSLFTLSPPGVLVETVKVSEDGKALILRLFGVSGKAEAATLTWGSVQPPAVWLTDLTEKPLAPVSAAAVPVPAYGIVHLRADLP
ncbi:MAG: glycosyl hydrolase-related protein [Verrucomicrobia bacterium]|nr:glycosyl hydrolase-related protein [Verrucomicrobiota bacterium]